MISKVRPAFWRAYDRLAPPVKIRAREVYRVFEKNPDYPSLCFKKLRGRDDVWSVRVNEHIVPSACVPATRLSGFGLARTTNSTICFREN